MVNHTARVGLQRACPRRAEFQAPQTPTACGHRENGMIRDGALCEPNHEVGGWGARLTPFMLPMRA